MAWLFGAVWFTAVSSPLLTTYARALGCGDFHFGLINALPFLAALLSLPASVVIDATGQRRLIFLTGLYIQRAIWLLIAVVPLWLFPRGASAEELKLVLPAIATLFLVMYFLQQGGQAMGGPAWVGWMSELVPDRIRGRYFARRRQLGVPLAIAATLVIGWVIDKDPLAGCKRCQILEQRLGFFGRQQGCTLGTKARKSLKTVCGQVNGQVILGGQHLDNCHELGITAQATHVHTQVAGPRQMFACQLDLGAQFLGHIGHGPC